MLKKWLCVLLALCLLVGGVGCKKKKDGTGGGFRFPIAAEPKTLDPQMANDDPSITVLCALFEGLTRPDNQGGVVPGAATWTVSEDKLTYTFTLKDSYWNANPTEGEEHPWNNNLPVTADDFVFAMQRLADPAIGSPLSGELAGIVNAAAVIAGEKPVEELGVKATDDKTLTITLDEPDEDLLLRLSTSPFFPCHRAFYEAAAGRYGLDEAYILSNGAFRLTAWNRNESLLLYKHEQYHDAANVAPEAVRFVIGTEDPVAALNEGNLDAAPLTAIQAAQVAKKVSTVTLTDTVRSLWLNTSTEALSEVHVRRALRDSIQWTSVDTFLSSAGETVAAGYVPPSATVSGKDVYRNDDNALPRKTDTDSATENLREGLAVLYPDQSASASDIHITVLAAEDDTSADLARYILQSWQKNLGITVTLTLVSEQELANRVKSGNYQAALYTHAPSGLTAAENLSMFASTATDNLSKLVDSSIDAAVTAARQGGREELTALEKALWDACPAIPISFPCRYYGFAEDTEGIVARPFGGGRYQSPLDFRGAKKWD